MLRDSGKEVVVKVLKPGVEDVLATDLDFLYLASRVFEFINPELSRMSLAAIVGDIRSCMLEEVRPILICTSVDSITAYDFWKIVDVKNSALLLASPLHAMFLCWAERSEM